MKVRTDFRIAPSSYGDDKASRSSRLDLFLSTSRYESRLLLGVSLLPNKIFLLPSLGDFQKELLEDVGLVEEQGELSQDMSSRRAVGDDRAFCPWQPA